MRRKTRLVILFTALAAVGALAAFGGKDPAPVAVVPAATSAERGKELAPAVTQVSAPAKPAAEEPAEMPARASLEQMGADPFNVEPPAPPAASAPPAAPAAPVAPPLPYRFAGRLHVGDAVEFYLAKGDEVFEVKKGDKIEGQYKVEKIGRSEMTLIHLASGTREKLEYAPPINEIEPAVAQPAPEKPAYGSLRNAEHGG